MIRFYEREVVYHGYVKTLRANITNYIDTKKLFRDARILTNNEINIEFLLRLRILCLSILFQKRKENKPIQFKPFF